MFATDDNIFLCIVCDGKIWLPDGAVPAMTDVPNRLDRKTWVDLGRYQDQHIYLMPEVKGLNTAYWRSLRECLSLPEPLFLMMSKAIQIAHMQQEMKFCGSCGGQTEFDVNQILMRCMTCQKRRYPQISPCVIVAIKKQDQILLARHRHRNTAIFTLLAGFVEAAESLESAVKREVLEETGLEIKNIQYAASQAWAFPSNLMVGFIAEHAGGEIQVDRSELLEADWFSMDQLPTIPPHGTIARTLIEKVLLDIQISSQDL